MDRHIHKNGVGGCSEFPPSHQYNYVRLSLIKRFEMLTLII